MLVALGANLVLLRSDASVYKATLGLQLAFYVAAVAGLTSAALASRSVFKLAGFLLLANASILTAWYRYWRGERVLMWAPSER